MMWRPVYSLLPLMLVSGSVFAESTVRFSVAAKSNAYYRGFEQASNQEPVYQGQVELHNSDGWYAGVWLSRVDFEWDRRQREVDYFAGYQRRWSKRLAMDITLQRYTFDERVHGDSYDWTELQLALHVAERWTMLVAQGHDWGGRDELTQVAELIYRHPLPGKITGYMSVGRHFADDVLVTNFNYFEAGLAATWKGFGFQAGWVDTSSARRFRGLTAANKWVFGISRRFSYTF